MSAYNGLRPATKDGAMPPAASGVANAGDDLSPTPLPAKKPNARPPRNPAPVEALQFVNPRSDRVVLEEPFMRDGGLIDAVTLRPLLAGEMIELFERARADEGSVGDIEILSVICDCDASILRGIVADDFTRIRVAANPFLPSALRTGG